MTPEMMLTMIVLVFVIVLFIFEWVRVDVVGILMMVLLPLAGSDITERGLRWFKQQCRLFHHRRHHHWRRP